MLQKMGANFGKGAVKGVKSKEAQLDTLVDGIVDNIRKNALGQQTTEKLDSLIEVVSLKLNNKADSLTSSVRDSLLSEYTALKIKRIVLEAGSGLEITADNLREKLLGDRTQFLVAQLRDDLLGDSTVLAVSNLRNELLGKQTKIMVDSLLASSIATIAKGYKDQLKPEIEDTLRDTKDTVEGTVKYIAWALGIVATVLAIIIALVWRKFSTRKKIMRILTQEINQIDSQEQYDNLVGKIKERTTKENLETSFQKILKEEELINQEKWVNKDQLLLKELNDRLRNKLDNEELDSVYQSLNEKGLGDHYNSLQNRL
ncbi:MAG: hypothetical protein AAFQ94_08655 [Bacteroidota bacterium]